MEEQKTGEMVRVPDLPKLPPKPALKSATVEKAEETITTKVSDDPNTALGATGTIRKRPKSPRTAIKYLVDKFSTKSEPQARLVRGPEAERLLNSLREEGDQSESYGVVCKDGHLFYMTGQELSKETATKAKKLIEKAHTDTLHEDSDEEQDKYEVVLEKDKVTSAQQPPYYKPTAPPINPPPAAIASLEQMMRSLLQKFNVMEEEISSLRNEVDASVEISDGDPVMHSAVHNVVSSGHGQVVGDGPASQNQQLPPPPPLTKQPALHPKPTSHHNLTTTHQSTKEFDWKKFGPDWDKAYSLINQLLPGPKPIHYEEINNKLLKLVTSTVVRMREEDSQSVAAKMSSLREFFVSHGVHPRLFIYITAEYLLPTALSETVKMEMRRSGSSITDEQTFGSFIWRQQSYGTSSQMRRAQVLRNLIVQLNQPAESLDMSSIVQELQSKDAIQIVHSRPDISRLPQSAVTALVEDTTRQILIEGLQKSLPKVYEYLSAERLLEVDILTLAGRANSKLRSLPPDGYVHNIVESGKRTDGMEQMNSVDQLLLIKKQQQELKGLKKKIKKIESAESPASPANSRPRRTPLFKKPCGWCLQESRTLDQCREVGPHCLRCSRTDRQPWPCPACVERRAAARQLNGRPPLNFTPTFNRPALQMSPPQGDD